MYDAARYLQHRASLHPIFICDQCDTYSSGMFALRDGDNGTDMNASRD